MTQTVGNPGKTVGPAATAPAERTGRHANTTLVVLFLSLGGLSFAVLQSLVAPALPAIAKDLHSSTGNISWVMTAYLLAASVLTPVLGRLGDMVGKRRILLVVLTILAAGTLLAAVATSLGVLIAARVLQGSAGAILPLSIGIVRDELPREKVSVTVGLLSAIFGIGGGLGIVLAGPIVDHLSWEWLFWFPLVLIATALLGIVFGVPESPVRTPGRLDILGTVILSASLVSLLLATSEGRDWGWSGTRTISLFILGGVALVVFVLVELRVHKPLIDMPLMGLRGVWATNFVGLALGFAMLGTFLLVPLLLELPKITGYGFGKTVSEAGLFLMPMVIVMMACGPLSGLLDRRFGPKLPLFLGALVVAAGFAVPAVAHHTIWQLLVAVLLMGAGIGLALAAMSNAIVESVPETHTAEATSVNAIVRTIGGSVGTAAVAAVIVSNSTPRGLPTDQAFTSAFWLCAGVGALAALAALILPSSRHRHEQAHSVGVDDLSPDPAKVRFHPSHRQAQDHAATRCD